MIKTIRVILVLSYFFLIAFVGSLICLFRPFNPDNTRICGRLFSWGALKLLGIEIELEGLEHLEARTPSIVVANHQDNLDLFVHGAIVPYRTVSIGKKALKYLPFFGQVYWLAGNIMIDRSKSKQSINTMTEITDAIRHHNTSIWVFAEGTRNHGKGLLPFKKGAFHMAINAQAPVLPICASTYAGKLDLNKPRSGKIIVKVLAPIPTEGLAESDLTQLLDNTRSQMLDTINDLDARLY